MKFETFGAFLIAAAMPVLAYPAAPASFVSGAGEGAVIEQRDPIVPDVGASNRQMAQRWRGFAGQERHRHRGPRPAREVARGESSDEADAAAEVEHREAPKNNKGKGRPPILGNEVVQQQQQPPQKRSEGGGPSEAELADALEAVAGYLDESQQQVVRRAVVAALLA
ncbi:hypothetical protein GGTG_03551 [Gaeumannomyces tritici R3-111a-1]|uniref:Uncharacterized protein n=1 Tax=Gaeumannomyces tritici (strain R3-111a-1) TaxID=644352 RepID=J3NQJ5_GAET3|nr:hypothetical protein GGTG_03551 [Gaeumannomyces tritici R3-111a-1]EJT78451.1 hypothetical protein GGTG_03551 [Gaeumannomyces tritici R3-111a-1]